MKNFSKLSFTTLVYTFLYAPIIVLIIYSFNDAKYTLDWHGFTWRWYQVLIHDDQLLRTVIHSLILAAVATAVAVIIGTFAAVSAYRYRYRGQTFVYVAIFILILAPDIMLGIGLLLFYNINQLPLGFMSLLLAHITFCIPFVMITIHSRLQDVDVYVFEAAKDLGASDRILLTKIVLPLLSPALLSAALLCFTLSLDDVIISYFVSGPSFQILPLKIYAMMRAGVAPEINALSTILLLFTFTIVTIATLLQKRP